MYYDHSYYPLMTSGNMSSGNPSYAYNYNAYNGNPSDTYNDNASYIYNYPAYDLSGMSSRLRKDMDNLNSLYPHKINELKQLVAAECDRMDYKGSMMYDECPDKVMFFKKCGELCDKADCHCQYARECSDKNFLKDMVSVLLAEEMSKRRKEQQKPPFFVNPSFFPIPTQPSRPPQPPKPPLSPQTPQPPKPPIPPKPPLSLQPSKLPGNPWQQN